MPGGCNLHLAFLEFSAPCTQLVSATHDHFEQVMPLTIAQEK